MSETTTSSEPAKNDVLENDGPVVEFKDVSITFDVKPVLKNISFTV